ncbi:hypothetical protein [Polyangium sorediatum]|uniref:Uncharacterized protein n=1 Tax=Polyangium sorediatum TaxID=889274 RepID=A0ABT6NNA6_9BACT|nr:hypothetical protein [Polyangium sorediatum]MDI1429692.1 hypothetical protein [Polyangium sorediatum]
MLAQQDRATPVPTGDDEDEDDAALVWQESPIVDVRDTIVGPTALPLLLRWKAGWASFWSAVADAFFGGLRVSERLPPVPPLRSRAISRPRPDKDGRVSVVRLREKVPHLPYERVILPALVRLEEQGVVALVQVRTGDPMAEILREGVTHVELQVPV